MESKQMQDRKENRRISLGRMRVEQRILVSLLAAASVAVFVWLLFFGRQEFSEDENRSLAQFPAFSAESLADGQYESDVDSWYADQFPLRSFWKRMDFTAQYMIGVRKFSDVYVGKDGYLLSEPVAQNETALARTAEAINQFALNHADRTIQMMLVPDAASVISDKLPDHVAAGEQISQIQAFEEGLDDSVDILDAGSILRGAAGTAIGNLSGNMQQDGVTAENPAEVDAGDSGIYYRTDHHWTTYGAYQVFLGVRSDLGIDSPLSYRSYVISDRFQGTLASRSGDHRSFDTIEVYQPEGTDVAYYVNYPDSQTKRPSVYETDQLDGRDQYAVFFGGNHALTEVQTTNESDRKLLVFKDSYANCFVPFLIPYYSEIVMIDPRYYYDNIETAMTSYGFTDVLFLYSADTLFADTSLADTLLSGESGNRMTG